MKRIADRGEEMTHSSEVTYFNRLIIDLKLREMGKEPSEPITMERLQSATQYLQKISQCRKRTMFR